MGTFRGWQSWLWVAFTLIATPLFAAEEAQVSAICDAASNAAAAEQGIPAPVLFAISLTETGRMRNGQLRPWPWTVNMEGRGFWFETRAEAMAYVQEKFDAGARSFDVGCFQINYKYHHQHFDSLEAMFDPMTNARYAARFMAELYDEKSDWTRAAGAYHSRNETFASRYRARYARILARLDDMPAQPELVLPTVVQTVVQTVRFPDVHHAFLSAPPVAPLTPYGNNQAAQTPPPATPSVLGSLAGGMLTGQTVTLLTGSNGSLF